MAYNLKSKRQYFKQQGIFHTEYELAKFMRSFFPEKCEEVYDPTCGIELRQQQFEYYRDLLFSFPKP